MGGGGGAAPVLDPDDDQSIGNDEYVWHVIEPQYYVDDPNNPGTKIIKSGTFAHGKSGVSFVRPKLGVTAAFIRKYFPNGGIAAIKVEDIRVQAKCLFAIENDPTVPPIPWPKDSHICAYKAPGKKRIKGGRIDTLIRLAESSLILAPIPTP